MTDSKMYNKISIILHISSKKICITTLTSNQKFAQDLFLFYTRKILIKKISREEIITCNSTWPYTHGRVSKKKYITKRIHNSVSEVLFWFSNSRLYWHLAFTCGIYYVTLNSSRFHIFRVHWTLQNFSYHRFSFVTSSLKPKIKIVPKSAKL